MIIVASVTSMVAEVQGSSSDCGQRHQKLLQDLIASKENYNTAGYRDCCQVRTVTQLAIMTTARLAIYNCKSEEFSWLATLVLNLYYTALGLCIKKYNIINCLHFQIKDLMPLASSGGYEMADNV